MSTPTQVERPWRATARTIFQFAVGLAVILPFVVQATGLEPEVYPWLAGILAVSAAVTRVMALPQVEDFLGRFLPFLAAEPASGQHAAEPEAGAIDTATAVLLAVLVLLVLIVVGVLR